VIVLKKKVVRITIIIVCIILLILGLRTAILYFGNYIPHKDCFGDEYKQIIYPTSISDYITAKEILKEADKALSTITNNETAKKDFGKLGYLCVTDNEAVKETHKLNFVAANLSNDSGYIWVKYSTEAYDKDGEVTFGTWDVLSRWELEKTDNKWVVTSIKEHP
jgi:hypothetical protein